MRHAYSVNLAEKVYAALERQGGCKMLNIMMQVSYATGKSLDEKNNLHKDLTYAQFVDYIDQLAK